MTKKSASSRTIEFITVIAVCAILAAGLVFAYQALTTSSTDDRSQAASMADQFVTRNGTKFFLGGKPFTFVGFNLFDSANTYFPDQNKKGYSCPRDSGWWTNIYTEADLDSTFAYAKQNAGASVIRFWAFQRYTNGGTDWSGIDKVIRVARKNGMKVIPVLDDGAGYCTYPSGAKYNYSGDTWYSSGYKQRMGSYALTYPEYVRTIVDRYKDEPTIFGWMMMNEADTSMKTQPDGSIVKDGSGPTVLVNFAKDIGGIIKGIDKNHLVTVGTQSNGASGATGRDFYSLYSLPIIDFAEVHDWGYWGGKETADHKFPHDFKLGEQNPLPGSSDGSSLPDVNTTNCQAFWEKAQIGCSFAMSILQLNKPVIVGESGISTKRWSLADRANLMDAKMNAFFKNGGAGYLVWQLNKIVDTEGFDVLTTTNDPIFAVMKKYAGETIPQSTLVPTIVPTIIATIKPTASPTVPPTTSPTAKPPVVTPTPVATIKPTATPVVTPTGTVTNEGATIQGEFFSRDGITARTISDVDAVYGKALEMLGNTTVNGTIKGPVTKISFRAKSVSCAGYGHINIKLNGKYIFDGNIATSTYKTYITGDLTYLGLKEQIYPLEIIYNNAYKTSTCTRTVVID